MQNAQYEYKRPALMIVLFSICMGLYIKRGYPLIKGFHSLKGKEIRQKTPFRINVYISSVNVTSTRHYKNGFTDIFGIISGSED